MALQVLHLQTPQEQVLRAAQPLSLLRLAHMENHGVLGLLL